MKASSAIFMALCGTSLLAGCASNSSTSAFGSAEPISSTLKAFIDTAQDLYKRGRELHRQSRLAEADQHYQQALKINPDYMDAQNAMAALDASRGDVERAIRLLTSLAEAHPDTAHIHANLGYAYYLNGQYALAKDALERATMLDPSNENSWKKLNMVVAEINRLELLAHREAANLKNAQSGESVEIKQIMNGVYALLYPDSAVPLQVPEPQPIQSTPVAATPNAVPDSRVELVNGNGIAGLARALRDLIAEQQWKVVRTRNHEQFSVRATRIEYAYSYYPAARQLAEVMGVNAVLRPNYQQEGSNLRVVLGRDYTSVEPLRQRIAGLSQPNLN